MIVKVFKVKQTSVTFVAMSWFCGKPAAYTIEEDCSY